MLCSRDTLELSFAMEALALRLTLVLEFDLFHLSLEHLDLFTQLVIDHLELLPHLHLLSELFIEYFLIFLKKEDPVALVLDTVFQFDGVGVPVTMVLHLLLLHIS